MSQLKIIKASAGSGKTFSLTAEFLKLVLNEPLDYYRHILAVTFTNKATAEMKDRILKELYLLGYGKKSDHLATLVKSTGKTEEAIRNKSKAILNRILHGYSWFKVETIDSFFQGVIRNFVRELNIPGYYNVELDQDKVLDEAIDRFLDKLGEDKKIVEWLLHYIEQKMGEGKSWDIKNELKSLGTSLFKEVVLKNEQKLQTILESDEIMQSFRDALQAIVKSFEARITKPAKDALSKIEDYGYTDNDFYFGKSGTISYLRKILKKDFDTPGSRIHTVLENPDKWPSGKCNDKDGIIKIGIEVLNPCIQHVLGIYEKESAEYYSALSILKNLHVLGVLQFLSKELSEIRNEKGLFLISDAAPFIQKIINNNDAPFIYEKTGNYYHNLLIDEFQDTSAMQWENFKPLISNSLSNNNKCLLVGDVKQAIYRWRNSEWEILADKVKHTFTPETIEEVPLGTNWRSGRQIIEFNNQFFKKAIDIYQGLTDDNSENFIPIKEIYSDIEQHAPDIATSVPKGYINIKIFDNQDSKSDPEYYGDELITGINKMINEGYLPGDMAVLVRSKREGTLISRFIINENKKGSFSSQVGVISNESLFLSHSPAVNLLVAALRFISTPGDKLIAATVISNYYRLQNSGQENHISFPEEKFETGLLDKVIMEGFISECERLRHLGLYAIVEKLVSLFSLQQNEEEKIYIHSFLDIVFEYSSKDIPEINNFLEYWDNEGSGKAVSSAETEGSVKVLTIHKSKGLQFPIVFIPFCDWTILPKANETLWIEPGTEPYNLLSIAPVNYNKVLEKSEFKASYNKEHYQTLVDNLNMLYVAFTRPENALFVFARAGNKDIKNTGDIVLKAISELNDTKEFVSVNEEEKRYTIGEPEQPEAKEKTGRAVMLPVNEMSTSPPEIKISSQAINYSVQKGENYDTAAYGRIMHAIMENVKTSVDLKFAIRQQLIAGTINKENALGIETLLNEAMENQQAGNWFTNAWTILTETDIIGVSGKIKRPDRVMIDKDNNAVIVDYKFGGEEERSTHKKQVSSYMHLLKDMGYKTVEGYLWYVLENDIIEVEI